MATSSSVSSRGFLVLLFTVSATPATATTLAAVAAPAPLLARPAVSKPVAGASNLFIGRSGPVVARPTAAQNATLSSLTVAKPVAPAALPVNTDGAWTIRREWSRSEVARYAQWVTHIYEKKVSGSSRQRAATLPQIVQDADMNLLLQGPYAAGNNDARKIDASAIGVMHSANACGTFPVLMFIYYCAVRGLPCSFTRVEGDGGDIRYSRDNHPVERFDPLSYDNLAEYTRAVCFGESNYTTGNWRTAPDLEGTDTVPAAVGPGSTAPGLTLLYNSDGHGLMVARVSPTGNVNILDAHPDGSITAGQTLAAVESVLRAVPEHRRERWYAGWRMIRLAASVRDAAGRIKSIRPFTNQEMRLYGYSDETYTDVIAIRQGRPVQINGAPVQVQSFPEYVRRKLTTAATQDVRAMVDDWAAQLHTLFSERVTFVAKAWENVLAQGAIPLPDNKNIYQADGRWEDWSSPSSDCDRKGAYFLGAEHLEQVVRDYEPGAPQFIVNRLGPNIRSKRDLAAAIVQEKRRIFDTYRITYVNCHGRPVTLSLNEIEKRLFLISFDPNHAPELRWGAAPDSPEAQGFRRISTPLGSGGEMSAVEAYKKERRLRFRLCRKDGVTALDDPDDPKGPPEKLLEQRMARFTDTVSGWRTAER
jgi:hypothetical protein